MAEGEEKPIVKAIPYAPIKFFVSSLNTFFGRHLVTRLRNEIQHPDNPNRIIGTVLKHQDSNYEVPDGVKKIIDTDKTKFFEEVLLNSDVIIYDLLTCDLKEIQFVISTLKIHPFEGQKVLICVSNVMTWAKSKPKQKKEGEQEEGDDNPPEELDSEEEGAPQPAQGEEKKTYVRFTDKDFTLRKPHPHYEHIKSVETLCIAAGTAKGSLKSYVVCSGILYGEGEILLQEYFKQARQQIPPKLPYYGKGKNRIPTVHIADLITYIEKIVEKTPNLPYVFALDHNPKPTQKKFVEAISKGIGTQSIESKPIVETVKNIELLSLNLRIKPTMVFVKIQEEEAAQEQEEGNERAKFKFAWRSKEGIQKSIENLRKQFNRVHGLQQEKIFIVGPPGSGKTFLATRMAQKYYLPHIHVKAVIKAVRALQNELGQEIRAYLAEKKETQVAAKQAEYDEALEKNNKIPKEFREPMEPFDSQKVQIRLSEQLLYKCYKWRLSRNDCLNRGYILDGYPKTYEDARELFMWIPPSQGEDAEQNVKKVLDERVLPTKCIVLEMTDQEIITRLQNLPEDCISNTHLNERRIRELLARYRKTNDPNTGNYILQDFFQQNKVSIHHVLVSSQTESLIESIIRPIAVSEEAEKKVIAAKLEAQKEARTKRRTEMDQKQRIIRDIQNEDYKMKKENEQNEEREVLDKKSLALRKYLDVNLVPILSEGIAQILKTFPHDPVDMLAEFLFKNSLKVANPDPSTFDF